MRIVIALAVLAVGVARSPSARAGNDVGVVVTGEGTMQTQLTAQFENWLSQHGHTLVQTPLPAEAIPLLDDCFVMMDPKACVRQIIEKRAKSSSTVYAHVKSANNVSNGTRDVTLTAYWFDKGRDAVTESTTCERCTDALLRTTADNVMKKLANNIVGHIKLKSTPEGAHITIDGQPNGVTPLDWDLPAGKHIVQMTNPGYEPQTREVIIASERTTIVSMDLERSDPGDGRSRILPISLLAGGVALIAGGAALIAINEEDAPNLPVRIYKTTTKGIVVGSVGVLAAAAGAYLLFRSPRTTSTPVVALTSDTAYVGWLGQF